MSSNYQYGPESTYGAAPAAAAKHGFTTPINLSPALTGHIFVNAESLSVFSLSLTPFSLVEAALLNIFTLTMGQKTKCNTLLVTQWTLSAFRLLSFTLSRSHQPNFHAATTTRWWEQWKLGQRPSSPASC